MSFCAAGTSRTVPQATDGIDLVEDFPLLVGDSQLLRCLDGPPELAGPNLQICQFVLVYELAQGTGELGAETLHHLQGQRLSGERTTPSRAQNLPACPGERVPSLPRGGLPCCGGSLRADTSRWSASARGCS